LKSLISTRQPKEKALLVGVELPSRQHHVPLAYSLEELERLATTAGATVLGKHAQQVRSVTPSTLIGRGKVDEIQASIKLLDANLVIIDEDLTPAQQRNLENAFKVRVVDRSQLILDIFAQRARSNEGKLQVELGTRGPGETQLEVDRRRIRERIGHLKRRLETVERTRTLQRKERDEVPFATLALVGYTNAGKSTLMNTLTRAGVFVENKLFATLDPTTRALRLPSGDKVMVVDTVGFINKIPHSLIEAFKSTLEEVSRADLLLHLVDMANPLYDEQIQIIEKVLREIGAGEIPTLLVPNKVDMVEALPLAELKNREAIGVCPISALTGVGVGQLLETVGAILDRGKQLFEASFSVAQGHLIALLRERGRIVSERYDGEGVQVTALVSPKLAGQLEKLLSANGARSKLSG
jgi:GTP-binding protein HflX